MTQAPLPEPGSLLAGKYRVERLLGRGGMGAVYAAQHEVLCRRVAVKVLLTDPADGQGLQRFLNEARAAARLDSDHVARVMDFGTLESGLPFMVLEYLEGQDLSQALAARGPLPVAEAVDYILQTCEALAKAHAAGIVHRDLKPANLYLARQADGMARIKVLDFGISKVGDQSLKPKSLTATSAMLGTPYYMSPEQVATPKLVDSRTDIWQLGICLYELLAGSPPFVRETLGELIFAIMNSAMPPLADKRPDVPAGLEQAISRCLERDVSRRFAKITELAESIAPFGSGGEKPLVARMTETFDARDLPFRVTPRPAGEPIVQTAASWGHASAPPRSPRKGTLVAASALGGAVLTAAAVSAVIFAGARSHYGGVNVPSAPLTPAASSLSVPTGASAAPPPGRVPAADEPNSTTASTAPAPPVTALIPLQDSPPLHGSEPGAVVASASPSQPPRRISTAPNKPAGAVIQTKPKGSASAAPASSGPLDRIPDDSRQ